ncbi:MAG: hypothetical protein ACRD0W_01030 [Acidimicrobiales bacterium]
MSDADEREITDDTGLSDNGNAVVRPETIRAKVNLPPARVVVGAGTLTVAFTGTARGEVTRLKPELTTAGVETEHVRTIRYSHGTNDGIRYVEVVDGNGKHIASGMGEAADALSELILYLLPQDHDDYPKG